MRRTAAATIAVLLVLAVLPASATAAPRAAAAEEPAHHTDIGWKARPARYDIVVKRDARITMSDGVRLAAGVYFPAREGKPLARKLPTILTQTPYNKNSGSLAFHSEYLVRRGYVQVIADVRGTGGSQGTWDSFGSREQLDGAELVQWVTNRPWSNRRVGLHGTSYGAINQIFTAAQRPKGLRAIFPVVPMADSYRDIVGTGGQINTSFIPLWLGLVTSLGLLPPTYTPHDPVGAAGAISSHAGNVAAFQGPTVATSMSGGRTAYDGKFHRKRSPIRVIDDVRVPTFIVGGWFDLFQRGEPLLYERLAANGVPSRLLMGPWYHTNVGEGLPTKRVPTLDELELRWFDHYVRGVDDPHLRAESKPVIYYRLGDERYRSTAQWPPARTSPIKRFLAGTAGPGSSGRLVAREPNTATARAMPWHPASGACSRSTAQWTATGAPTCTSDQRLNDQTGLVYDMPVRRPLHLAGPIAARLYLSTTRDDAAVSVRLEDVAPDGSVTQLSQGWQVVSMRARNPRNELRRDGLLLRPFHPFLWQTVLPVKADRVYETWVEVFPTAALVEKGHTLRLAIQPSDAPHLTPPAPQGAKLAGGIIRVHQGPRHRSALILPTQR